MKKNSIIAVVCLACLPLFAQDISELKTEKDKLSYCIGANVAQSLKQQDMVDEIDLNILKQAMSDELKGNKLLLSQEYMSEFMQSYFGKKQEFAESKRKEEGEKNKIEGVKFLEQNKKKKGVLTTASGLQYEIITDIAKGKAKELPKGNNLVKVKYEGKLLNGTVFDSTEKNSNGEAIEFPLDRVIKGWTEGVALMSKGTKYRFYIPSELAYGENGAGKDIAPNSVLIFDVELIDFKDAPADLAPAQQK